MGAQVLLTKTGPWTAEDLAGLPDDGRRYEILDGSLLVSPPPSNFHQGVASRLALLLEAALPPGWEVLSPGSVRLGASLRSPDVLVVRAEAVADPARLAAEPEEVLLAVEVMGPGSVHEDRVGKPAVYAEAGIPHFWRFEPAESALHVHRLEPPASTYTLVDVHRGTREARLREPVALTLTPAHLLP